MRKHIILILKLFPLYLLAACATLYPVETAYKDALRAESSNDLEAAESHYQKAFDEANKSKDTRWYIERALFPDGRKQWGIERVPVTTNMIQDDLKRVSAAQKATTKGRELAVNGNPVAGIKVSLGATDIGIPPKNEDVHLTATTDIGRDFLEIKDLLQKKLYKEVINKADTFSSFYPAKTSGWEAFQQVKLILKQVDAFKAEAENAIKAESENAIKKAIKAEKDEAEKVMLEAFSNIITNYKNKDCFSSIASQDRDYIANYYIGKYQNVEGSRWQEIEKLVNEERVMRVAFQRISTLDKNTDYTTILSEGIDYINRYRKMECSRWAEVEKLVNEARVKEKEIMGSTYQSIISVDKNRYYEFIISKGRDYIVRYRNVEGSDWQKIENLVMVAEKIEKVARKEEAKERKKEEEKLEPDLVKAAHMFRSGMNKALAWKYRIEHNTTSDKIKNENEKMLKWFNADVIPLGTLLEKLAHQYEAKYGAKELRDFAIRNNFLDVLEGR